ncbi:hypothetical protein ACL9RL_13740 [Plantibacter sp. Mn2098]|uniref:hypothetical protein n=1 Tax=Plantibacter sp. Mn2098 TaxID=3395266 RepID=UPI003BCE4AA6
MTDKPICRTCNTDEFLVYSGFVPGRMVHLGGRATGKPHWVPSTVNYLCGACGRFDSGHVPDGWLPPSDPPRRPERPTLLV